MCNLYLNRLTCLLVRRKKLSLKDSVSVVLFKKAEIGNYSNTTLPLLNKTFSLIPCKFVKQKKKKKQPLTFVTLIIAINIIYIKPIIYMQTAIILSSKKKK